MKKSLVVIILLAIATLSNSASVMATKSGGVGSSGSAGGSANVVACSSWSMVCSTHGAAWRWYSTTSNDVNIDGGREYANGEDPPKVNPSYARGDVNIKGCAKVGGYYRYGFVAFKPTGNPDMRDGRGTRWYANEQVGLMAIGGNGDLGYRSVKLGGKNKYINTWADWSTVETAYKNAKKYEPEQFTQSWNSNSNLAYFCYAGKSFQAQAQVDNQSTGYALGSDANGGDAQGTSVVSKSIECNNDNGCDVGFKFYLKKIFSVGNNYNSTVYTIQKRINSGDWTNVTSEASYSPGTSGNNVYSGAAKIHFGETICYRIKYKPFGGFDNDVYRYVRACASGAGTIEAKSTIDVKIKQSTDSDYTDEVWAKPTDTINLRGSYTPTYQKMVTKSVNKLTVGSFSKNSGTVITLFDKIAAEQEGMEGWNNAFSIKLTDDTGIYSEQPIQRDPGFSGTYGEDDDKIYAVAFSDVGQAIGVNAITNHLDSTKTTPKSVKLTSDSNGITATVDTSSVSSDTRYIKVPYNFKNSICFVIDDENKCKNEDAPDELVNAGGSATVQYYIRVGTKRNSKLNDEEYATSVKGAKYQIVTDGDVVTTEKIADLNITSKEDQDIGLLKTVQETIKFPDAPAGTRVCFTAKVYPATSGADDNLDPNGDGKWATSTAQKCFVITKKPSLQVWGGNIYSNGTIKTAITTKKRLAGHEDGTYTFGSWGELGIIALGQVTGLSSGAGLGYSGVGLAANPGGTNQTQKIFCYVSTLSFANQNCTSYVGNLGSASASSLQQAKSDKEAVLAKLDKLDDVRTPEGDANTYYIMDNITHDGEPAAHTLDELPKTVIYAENIYIDCSVTMIEALLIAEKNVVTCNNFDNDLTSENIEKHINDRINSNKLTINGAIIAGRLIANRTYGAAPGDNSIKPAEIINFDPTLYLWGNAGTTVEDADWANITTNYIRELAPRY